MLRRAAAVVAVLVAIVVLAILLFGGGKSYEAKAIFQNAGQLVKGNQVEVSGQAVGTISDIRLTDDGHAEVVMSLDKFAPLHDGTTATIRATSLSGIANRYIALSLGPNSSPELPSGATIKADRTTSPVDLDQVFNTLDPKTRKSLQRIIHGQATWYGGRAPGTHQSPNNFHPAPPTPSTPPRAPVRGPAPFH